MEYKKRILFCRLRGNLNNNTSKKLLEYLKPIIINNKIKYMVLNIKDLIAIDEEGRKSLLCVKEYLSLNRGKLLVLNNDNSDINTKLVAIDLLCVNG